jgi:hypothetical protein
VGWTLRTWLLALLASVVPLGSVIFLSWAEKTGRMSAPIGPRPADTTPIDTGNDVTDLVT